MMNHLEVAWGQVVEHLRAEADWRADRWVEVLRSYRYSEPLGQEVAPGRSCYLEANLSHAIVTLDESGTPVDFESGDVFEHVDTMVRLGDEAMGQIERELQQQASFGDDKALPLPLGHATEGGSAISLQVAARELPHELQVRIKPGPELWQAPDECVSEITTTLTGKWGEPPANSSPTTPTNSPGASSPDPPTSHPPPRRCAGRCSAAWWLRRLVCLGSAATTASPAGLSRPDPSAMAHFITSEQVCCIRGDQPTTRPRFWRWHRVLPAVARCRSGPR